MLARGVGVWLVSATTLIRRGGAAICDTDWITNECPKYCKSSIKDKCCAYRGVTVTFMIPDWGGATKGIKSHKGTFENCTGGAIDWGSSPSKGKWPGEVEGDVGTNEVPGTEFYDGYLIKTVWLPTYSTRLEDLNEYIKKTPEAQWMDINAQPRKQVTFHGKVKGLPYEADFAHLLVRRDLIQEHAAGLQAALGISEAQWRTSTLPQTYEELATIAEYFNGRDLNNDSKPDYGLCWPIQDYAWVFQFYGILATMLQYQGWQQGVFFDLETFEPLVDNPAFRETLKLFRRLIYASHTPVIGKNSLGESNKLFAAGRCAFYMAKRGGLKYAAIKKVKSGAWMPRKANGDYWPPMRLKSPGSTRVYDRSSGKMRYCTGEDSAPSAEFTVCPHVDETTDRVPGSNFVVNRAPFFGTGVLAAAMRASADQAHKNLLFDFITFTNVREQSTKYVAEVSTWDSYRSSQMDDREYHLVKAGWGEEDYDQMRTVVAWGLSLKSNPAMDLRVRGAVEYQLDFLVKALVQFCFPIPDMDCRGGRECECRLEGNDVSVCRGSINTTRIDLAVSRSCVERDGSLADEAECGGLKSIDQTVQFVKSSWEGVTAKYGRLKQLRLLRRDLSLPLLDRQTLCTYHEADASAESPGICDASCPSGTFYNPTGEGERCTQCPRGKVSSKVGMTECGLCEKGRFQNLTGQSECDPCAVLMPGGISERGSLTVEECTCPTGRYLLRDDASKYGECASCTEGLLCHGGNGPPMQDGRYFIRAKMGTDRASPVRIAPQVVECSDDRKCPRNTPLGSCPDNRESLACDDCKVGYFESDEGRCEDCSSNSGSSPFVLSVIGAFCVLMCLAVFATRAPSVQMASSVTVLSVLSASANIVQTLGAYSVMSIVWVEPFVTLKKIFQFLTFRIDYLNPGCVFAVNLPVYKYLVSLLMFPVAILLLLACFAVLRAAGRPVERSHVLNKIGLLWLILFLSLALSAVSSLQCKDNPDGSSSVMSVRSVICWDGSDHAVMVVLSILAILIYVVSFLAIIVRATLLYPQMLTKPGGLEFIRVYRFLFSRFHPEQYYYGVVFTLRSLLVALIPVMLANNVHAQVLLMMVVIAGMSAFQNRLFPWCSQRTNQLDSFTTVGLIVILLAGAMLVDSAAQEAVDTLQVFLVAILLLFLAAVVVVAAVNLYVTVLPPKLYAVFLSHHKGSAAVLARWFKMCFQQEYTDNVFLDSDELDRLDLIFDTVAFHTKNFILLGTRIVLERMWCAGEIAAAVRYKVNFVVAACDDYKHPSDTFISSVGDLWSDGQKAELNRLGVDIASIQHAYRALPSFKEVGLRRNSTPAEQANRFKDVAKCCKGMHMKLGEAAMRLACLSEESTTGEMVLTGNLKDGESRTTCQVLQMLLQRFLQVSVVLLGEVAHAKITGTKYVVLVLSSGVTSLPEVACSLVVASQAKLEVVPIQADQSFVYPHNTYWDDLNAGKVVDPLALQEKNVALASVVTAYQRLFNVLALKFSPWGSERIQHTECYEMVARFRTFTDKSETVPRAGIVSDEARDSNKESRRPCDTDEALQTSVIYF
jgi:multiple sugar transport system substrate-binding protein